MLHTTDYHRGFNPNAFVAFLAGIAPNFAGFLNNFSEIGKGDAQSHCYCESSLLFAARAKGG